MKLVFNLPFPPSVNKYWRHILMGRGVRALLSADGRVYKSKAVMAIKSQLGKISPIDAPVAVRLVYHRPNWRKRDLDNLQKAVLDACTTAGIWRDDSLVEKLFAWWGDSVAAPGHVEVCIWNINSITQDNGATDAQGK